MTEMQHPKIFNYKDDWIDKDYAVEELNVKFFILHFILKMTCYQSCLNCCGNCVGFYRTWCNFPCCCVNHPYQQVQQGTEAIIERFGRYIKTLKPGLRKIQKQFQQNLDYMNPCTETIQKIDTKTNIIDLPKQSVLTKDNLTCLIDASVYFRIINVRMSIYRVCDVISNVKYLTFATLRNISGQNTLQELLEKRLEIQAAMQDQVAENVSEWGVKIEQIFIKDMILSADLQVSLSTAAKEKRLAEAKLISAKADVESAKLMRASADALNSRPAMQIRYLETIQQITASPNTKIVFLPKEGNKNDQDHKITQGLLA